jgi:hypothetical protein
LLAVLLLRRDSLLGVRLQARGFSLGPLLSLRLQARGISLRALLALR